MNEPADGTRNQTPDDVRRLTPLALAAGDTVPGLSSWVLERKLGGGGFGEVWLARHAVDAEQPPRAVKFCTDPEARHRLVTHERNVVVRVMKYAAKHPNLVPLLEYNLDGEAPWLMYEFVEGDTLARAIGQWRGAPPAARAGWAVRTLRPIAGALAKCHRLDPPLVHRDLKPQNVLMAGGVPRVTDFGIGGVAVGPREGADAGAPTAQAARLPTALKASGTRLYAPPEQLYGSPPSPRDDVYALGVIAYQMFLGDLAAVPGTDAADVLRELGVPADVTALVVKSVAMDPDRRPRDAGEWEAVLAGLPAELHEPTGAPVRVPEVAAPPQPTPTEGPSVRTDPNPVPPRDPQPPAAPGRAPTRRWIVLSLAVLVVVGLTAGLTALVLNRGGQGPAPAQASQTQSAPEPPAKQPPTPTKESTDGAKDKERPSVQQITGNDNVQIGNNSTVGNVTINPKLTPVKIFVLSNSGSPALVLKEIKDKKKPDDALMDRGNWLGFAPVGTEIRYVKDVEPVEYPGLLIKLHCVEILEGEFKGKVGWVSSASIQSKEVLR